VEVTVWWWWWYGGVGGGGGCGVGVMVVVTASETVSDKIGLAYYGVVSYQLTNMRAADRNEQP
jgi:hypothetical protein